MGLGSYWVTDQLLFQRNKSFKTYEALLCQNAKRYQEGSHKVLCLFTEFPGSNCYSGQNSQGFSWEDLINHAIIYKFSPATVNFLFHHKLRSSRIQPSQTRLPTSPPKQQTNSRQSVYTTLPIFRNFTKINSCYRSNCLTCFCMQKEPDLVPLQWGRAALLVPVSDLTFFPAQEMI